MSRIVRIYLVILLTVFLGWLGMRGAAVADFFRDGRWLILLGVTALYLCSHLFRMLRLALLTLDERDKVFSLISAHTLTAFPSSLLPYKIGEVLRLTAFFHVFNGRQKALAVWLAERFGDVVVIGGFIVILYQLNVSVPATMRLVLVLFVVASVVGLLGLFAVAKVFVYLNRHLVLASYSVRGLMLLRVSYALRRLELDIYKSVEGRFAGFLLLSILIWVIEILAMALFIQQFSIVDFEFSSLFSAGLLASLPGGNGLAGFGIYQSLALVVLTFVFPVGVWVTTRFRLLRP